MRIVSEKNVNNKKINKKYSIKGNMKDLYINDNCGKLLNWYSIQYYFFAYPSC
jgi:hypothetical protein